MQPTDIWFVNPCVAMLMLTKCCHHHPTSCYPRSTPWTFPTVPDWSRFDTSHSSCGIFNEPLPSCSTSLPSDFLPVQKLTNWEPYSIFNILVFCNLEVKISPNGNLIISSAVLVLMTFLKFKTSGFGNSTKINVDDWFIPMTSKIEGFGSQYLKKRHLKFGLGSITSNCIIIYKSQENITHQRLRNCKMVNSIISTYWLSPKPVKERGSQQIILTSIVEIREETPESGNLFSGSRHTKGSQ